MEPEESKRRRGFPLGALFGFVSLCAILLALIAPIVRLAAANDVDWEEFIVIALIVALPVAVLGVIVGCWHHRQPSGCLLGGGIGMLIGPLIGLMAALPITMAHEFLGVIFGGSALLLGLGAFLRLSSRPDAQTLHQEFDPSEPAAEAEIVDDIDTMPS